MKHFPIVPQRKLISTVTHVSSQQKGVGEVYRQREQRGPPAPVNVGDTHDVKIESKGKGGDGIARIQGFVVFVPGTNPGDEVKVRINAVRRRFAIAEVVTE